MPASSVRCSNNPNAFHTHPCTAAQCDPPGTMVATCSCTSHKCTVDCEQQSFSTSRTLVSCFWCVSVSDVGPDGAVVGLVARVGATETDDAQAAHDEYLRNRCR